MIISPRKAVCFALRNATQRSAAPAPEAGESGVSEYLWILRTFMTTALVGRTSRKGDLQSKENVEKSSSGEDVSHKRAVVV